MIIGDHFIFIHNPRCGGSVLRSSLEGQHTHPASFWHPQAAPYFGTLLDFAHLRMWELAALFPEIFERLQSGPSFVFFRDPMARLLSALHRHFDMRQVLWSLPSEHKLGLFRDFVSSELSPHRILTDPLLIHFNRQKWFIALGDRLLVRHIIPMVGNPLAAAQALLGLPIKVDAWREPPPPNPMLMDDPVLRRFAREYYAPDYELIANLGRG